MSLIMLLYIHVSEVRRPKRVLSQAKEAFMHGNAPSFESIESDLRAARGELHRAKKLPFRAHMKQIHYVLFEVDEAKKNILHRANYVERDSITPERRQQFTKLYRQALELERKALSDKRDEYYHSGRIVRAWFLNNKVRWLATETEKL